MKFFFALMFGLAGLAVSPLAVSAETYPAKPIRMVVAFPAGGPTDLNARHFAKAIGEQLGQPVVVENKPGAGANIASAFVAGSAADGYTIYYNTSSLLLGPLLYKSVRFDPLKDFTPVVKTAGTPLTVVVNPSLPVNSLTEFVSYVKQNPGKVYYASSGTGTIDHLGGELLNNALGIKMMHVPYKGTAPALTDLVGGLTQAMVTTLNTARPFAIDKRLKALAIASPNRSPLLPDVPTVSEAANLPGFEITAWQGIVVPAGTPNDIVTKLNSTVNQILAQKEFRAKLTGSGSELYGGTPAEYGAYLRSEMTRWKVIIQQAGVQPE